MPNFDVNDPLGLKQSKDTDTSTPDSIAKKLGIKIDVSDPLGLKAKPAAKAKPTILGKAPVSDQPVRVKVNGGDTKTIIDQSRVKKLQSKAKQLEEEIRSIESSGMFDATNKRQELANHYLQLQKMQSLPQQIGGVPPAPAGTPKPPVTTGITSLTPPADPFDKLRFDYKAFKRMLDNGDNIVQTRDGESIPRNVAERLVSKVTKQAGPFQGAPLQNQRENQINEAGMAPKANAFTQVNPNQQRFSTANNYLSEIGDTLGAVYTKATGLNPEEAPYAHAALGFLGGLVTTPLQVAKGAAYGAQHPIQALKNTPELLGQAAESLNLFDPNISGSDRFGRFLNVAFTVGGGAHFHEFVKRSIADGSLYRLGAKLGLDEAATTRDAIDFFKKQQEIHGANLENANILGKIDLNQSKRSGKNLVAPEVQLQPQTKSRFGKKPEGNIIVPKKIHTETATLSDPFGLGIPVSHELEGIHPTPEFDGRKATTSTPEPEDINHANEQILDHAVRNGLKPEAADFVELHASDHDSHIHHIWTPEQLDAVGKSKLSGRRQIKALDWFASNRVTDPELIRKAINVWETNGIRFTGDPSEKPQAPWETPVKSSPSSEHATVRGDLHPNELDRIVSEQQKVDATRAQSEAPPTETKPKVPVVGEGLDHITDDDERLLAENEQIAERAKAMGMKPEAVDHMNNVSDQNNDHIHDIYKPEVIDAVSQSKLSGRRQINALEWFAANRVSDPRLIARAIKVFEENPVRFTPHGGREVDENFRKANTSPENTSIRGDNGNPNELDQIVRDQQSVDAGREPGQEAPQPKAPEVKPAAPKPQPKAPKAPKVETPKPETPKPEVKAEAPPKVLSEHAARMSKGVSDVIKRVERDGPFTIKTLRDGKSDYITESDARKALKDAVNAGVIYNPDPRLPSEFELTDKGKAIHDTTQTLGNGISIDERPSWLKPTTTHAAMTGNLPDGWATGDVNGKPWYTNTHVALEGTPKGPISPKSPNISRIVPSYSDLDHNALKPVGISRSGGVTRLWFDDGTPIDLKYYDFVKKQYPNADFVRRYDAPGGRPSARALGIVENGEVKGVMMPMSADAMPDGIRGLLKGDKVKETGGNYSKAPDKAANPQPSLLDDVNEAKGKKGKATPTASPTPAPVAAPPAITPKEAGLLKQASDSLKKTFAPTTLGEGPNSIGLSAKNIGLRLREHYANIAATQAKDSYKLKLAYDHFDKKGAAYNQEFIKRMEAGQSQGSPELDAFAKSIREVLDGKRAEIQALGQGQLEHFDVNYFPHLFERPGAVEKWVEGLRRQKRPLEGNKGALKQRTHGLLEEAMSKGYKLISDNPVDVVISHSHQMDMYIQSQRLFSDMKAKGQVKYLKVGATPPDGWVRLDDKLFQVNHSGIVAIHEGYDEKMMGQLNQLARDLGVRNQRKVSLKGHPNAWGLESKGGVETKFGGPETVLTHEIGHAIDRKFGLRRALFQGPERDVTLAEMKKLAALRYEGSTPSNSYKKYTEKQQEMVANLVHAYVHAPHLLEKIAPETTKLFEQFIDSKPQLKALRDIKPSLVLGTNTAEVRAPGVHKIGEYIAPTQVAAVLNNSLGKGFRNAFFAKQYFAINNGMNQINLSFSGFHYMTTSFNSMISEMALGVEHMIRGDVLGGVKHGALGLSPTTPFRDYYAGKEIQKSFLEGIGDPKMRTIIDGVLKGGGRYGEPEIYSNQAVKAFKKAWGRSDIKGIVGHALFAATEYSSANLMQNIIPRVKLGVFSQMLQSSLESFKGPMTDEEFRDIAAKAWDSVDNRMGQMVYDNRFWNPFVKDLAMASTRSVGWNFGTLSEIGGGAMDASEGIINKGRKVLGHKPVAGWDTGLSHRAAYAVALPITMGVYGAIYQKLMTGQWPQRLRDAYFPLTGRKNPDGTEERNSMPSYMKDEWGYSKDPIGTLKNKMAPLPSELISLYTNSDYFSNKIRADDDPWYKQGISLLKYGFDSAKPFIWTQLEKQHDEGHFDPMALMGFNKASAALSKTPAVEKAQNYAFEQVPKGKRTTEQSKRQQELSLIVGKLRNGEKSDALKKMKDMKVTGTEARYIYNHAQGELLPKLIKSLSIDQALRVYEVATVQEKKSIVRDVEKKLFNAKQNNKGNFSADDFQTFEKRLRDATPKN